MYYDVITRGHIDMITLIIILMWSYYRCDNIKYVIISYLYKLMSSVKLISVINCSLESQHVLWCDHEWSHWCDNINDVIISYSYKLMSSVKLISVINCSLESQHVLCTLVIWSLHHYINNIILIWYPALASLLANVPMLIWSFIPLWWHLWLYLIVSGFSYMFQSYQLLIWSKS